MNEPIPNNQLPTIPLSGADALDALKRIYEETKQAINEGKTIFVGSNKFEDRDDHIIRIEK